MSSYFKLATTMSIAAFLLAMTVHAADATRLEASNRLFRIAFSSFGFELPPIEIDCPVTLEGSFHSRTIEKRSGAQIGYVTRATVNDARCAGGDIHMLNGIERVGNTLPWSIEYITFEGPLPNITRIHVQIIGLSVLLQDLFDECLYSSTQSRPAVGRFERNTTTGAITNFTTTTSEIPLHATLVGTCPRTTDWAGVGVVTVQGSREVISVRLVA